MSKLADSQRILAVLRRLALALLVLSGVVAPTVIWAQSAGQSTAPAVIETERTETERALEQAAAVRAEQRAARAAELRAVEQQQRALADVRARLEAEVREVRADRGRLNASLIDAARRAQDSEARVAAIEARLEALAASELAIRRSLDGRRGLISDVLAALQRMGRRPPPAVLVRPEDVLEAVRASILMGAVLPELRSEIEALAAELGELVRLRAQAATDRTRVSDEFRTLATERQRLAALLEARAARETAALAEGAAARARDAEIGRDAAGLRELIDRLEGEIGQAMRQAEATRRAAEAQTREARDRMAQLAARDPARLQPQAPFQDLRGRLTVPVAGSQSRAFGAADGFGGSARGATFRARPGAVIAAPADGWVAFAGPFRGYGQLVILHVGGGYHVLLAGLRRTDVARNQFVLAGEPLGALGDVQDGSVVALGDGNGAPILYVEFRKDGQSIDPAPWWAIQPIDRVRG